MFYNQLRLNPGPPTCQWALLTQDLSYPAPPHHHWSPQWRSWSQSTGVLDLTAVLSIFGCILNEKV